MQRQPNTKPWRNYYYSAHDWGYKNEPSRKGITGPSVGVQDLLTGGDYQTGWDVRLQIHLNSKERQGKAQKI